MTDWQVGPTTRLSSLDGLLAIRRNLFLLDDPIDQPAVGADQIASFAQLSSLEVLDVSATYIDDTACESLCRLKNLKVLFLHSSRVTTIGVARLKNAFPQLDLQGYPGRDPATIDVANVPIDDPNWIPPNIPMF